MTRVLAVVAVVCASFVSLAFADGAPPTLVVTGSGVAEVEPDQLEVSFAVVSQSASTEEAMDDNAKRMRKVMAALERAGIAEDDLETVGFSVSPNYDYSNRRDGVPPKITGYTVRNTVRARTLELELAGELIETGVDAGADSVSGVDFGLADPQAHRAQAIAIATANARADAQALADAAGLELAGILEIVLDPTDSYRPYQARNEMASARVMSDGAPPMQPGEVSLSARVRVVYVVRD